MTSDQRSAFRSGAFAGVVGGLVLATLVAMVSGWISDEEDDPVAAARQVIEDNYFRDPDPAELDEAGIEGMVESIKRRYRDRFSHYFTAKELKAFHAATSGRFSGVGLTVTEVPRGLRIASVLPDTPAERAELQEGDLIVAVDGKSIRGISSDVSTGRIKGPEGTEVTLSIVPADGSKPYDVTLERDDVRVPAAEGVIRRDTRGDKVAYVQFHTFSEGAHGELRSEIERLYRQGAEGLVLDLRGNGGGLLNEAVLSSSIFLEDGNVVSTRSRTQGDTDYPAVGDAIDPRPTVLLVNGDTASAAEIMAAALQQNDLAEVVGTATYGKGTFQELIGLPAGDALELTIGEYLTADGTSILGEGVKPDIRVADDPDTPIRAAPDDLPAEEGDEQQQRALEVLAGQIAAQ